MPDDAVPNDIRRVLEAARADLVRRADAVVKGAEAPPGGISFGKRVGEGTSIAIERFTDVALHGQLMRELAAVEAALDRLDTGTYGTCERCAKPIAPERLEYVPSAARCVACA